MNKRQGEDIAVLWFRNDLRLTDNPALEAAIERNMRILPLFIWSPEEEGKWQPGAASRWWLHYSLKSLAEQLASYGGKLIIKKGDTRETLEEILSESGSRTLLWNRRYEPSIVERDKEIKSTFKKKNIETISYNASLLIEPWEVSTKASRPFQVFTPFWKSAQPLIAQRAALHEQKYDCPKLESNLAQTNNFSSLDIHELELLPSIRWDEGLEKRWTPGERGAVLSMESFVEKKILEYKVSRDFPAIDGVSYLSPHLHFGEISPWRILSRCLLALSHYREKNEEKSPEGIHTFLKELGWREFAHHILFHFPHTANRSLRDAFLEFPWHDDRNSLQAWKKGRTGFPIVDAGMRELWRTGWMHNRVRMIVASFLTKDLLIDWKKGADWFFDTLVDADLANNTLGWQWAAGCGADAAPYFRIFNPILQGKKFDPTGEYVREWVPELRGLPQEWIHTPWSAPASILENANLRIGTDYPHPIVDHSMARQRALAAFASIKEK